MVNLTKKMILIGAAVLSSGLAVMNTGCASGGYHLSRQFAGWINQQSILLRILLYIFIGGAFFFTLIADFLIFNTMDFWTGKISQGTYEFKDQQKTFVVKHSLENDLKRTVIEIKDLDGKKIQEVALKETADHRIEYYVDGTLKAKVDNIDSIPRVTYLDKAGSIIKQENIPAYTVCGAH